MKTTLQILRSVIIQQELEAINERRERETINLPQGGIEFIDACLHIATSHEVDTLSPEDPLHIAITAATVLHMRRTLQQLPGLTVYDIDGYFTSPEREIAMQIYQTKSSQVRPLHYIALLANILYDKQSIPQQKKEGA